MNLSESKLQDYIEVFTSPVPTSTSNSSPQHASFRIDAQQTVIMGLPPPEVDNIVSWRNFGLAHSIRDLYLKVHPYYLSLWRCIALKLILVAGSSCQIVACLLESQSARRTKNVGSSHRVLSIPLSHWNPSPFSLSQYAAQDQPLDDTRPSPPPKL